MKLACLFPGQGSQYVGMAKELGEHFPWTRELYEEASDAIGTDLLKLCKEGPEDKLKLTENAQPAILVTSYAWFEVLRRNLDFRPQAGAGHSLGEYSALTAAGALTLAAAARLVRKRGQLMQSAVPVGKGSMAALIGLDDAVVVTLCEEASQGESSRVVAANFNAPGQVVIAGHTEAVDRAVQLASGATKPEFKARKAIPLNVSAPFHSPLMKEVAGKFHGELQGAQWQVPAFPVVSNLDAELRGEGDWAALLRDQIDHPVRWTESMQKLETQGYGVVVEMGPGKVLAGLVKRIARGIKIFTCDSLDEMKKFEKAYQEGFDAA